ncbi:MAG: hypothetical protein J7L96_08610 [Bacteroidales bacterium]|nr:hypothetical protein [Bacteroidales bacterium]
MLKLSSYILTALLLLVFSSCEKDPPIPALLIGSTDLMDVSYYGHLVKFANYGEEHSLQIDVDDDGTDDITFFIMANDSLGDHDRKGSTVSTSNDNLEICMMASTEDLFKVRSYEGDVTKEYLYNERSHFYCPDCTDLGVSYQTYFTSPVIFLKSDTLAALGQWSGGVQVLSTLDQGKVISTEDQEFQTYNYIVTGFWNTVENGYMIFRLKVAPQQYRYGWVKISLTDYRGINITEKAISTATY